MTELDELSGAAVAVGVDSAAGASLSGPVVLGADSAIISAMFAHESWGRSSAERVHGFRAPSRTAAS